MVADRTLYKRRYLIAGIITALIFISGILLGLVMDYERLNFANEVAAQQEVEFKSLQINSLIIDEFKSREEICSILHVSLEQVLVDLGDSLERVEKFETESNINKENYELMLRTYFLDNMRYWIFARKSKEICDMDLVNVLYFYSKESCDICPTQGTLLTYYKKKYGNDLLIFPINTDLRESEDVIPVIMQIFDIKEYPSIIIDNRKFEGLVNKEDLGKLICASFKNEEKCQLD